MAIWKDLAAPRKGELSSFVEAPTRRDAEPRVDVALPPAPSSSVAPAPGVAPLRRAGARGDVEALVNAGLTIEGKIQGAGHIRIAGRLNGNVTVDGNLAIDAGAKVVGGVVAATVTIGGELEGNIHKATSVELLASGVLNGDLKAKSLIVAAGSRMRGRVEFGWPHEPPKTSSRNVEVGVD